MLARKIFVLILLLNAVFLNAQLDFNKYTTIEAAGELPKELTGKVYDEINQRIREKTAPYENDVDTRNYLDWSLYAVDRLIHSGFVVYGDPISLYMKNLSASLLRDRSSIRDSLSYFTLKADMPVIFVSDEGALFTSTGLISRVENDAQLSFLLAHALAHYIEKHTLKKFYWSKVEPERFDWVRNFHSYDEVDEHKADQIAIQLYEKTGFDLNQIKLAYEFMRFSHLPFEEVPIETSILSSEKMFVPEMVIPSKNYPIKEKKFEGNSEGPFPYLTERMKSSEAILSKLQSEPTISNFLISEEKFLSIRNVCRFETMRSQLISGKHAKALYSIYILEQEFPDSEYLKRMKAHCWLEMYQYEKLDLRKQILPAKNSLEGESGKFYQMLGEINDKGWQAFAMRNIYDLYTANPEDVEVKALYSRMVKEVASDGNFNINDYATRSFEEISKIMASNESYPTNSESENNSNSKYDKIRKGKDPNISKSFDSTKYYLYGVYDIIKDVEFLEQYKKDKRDYYDRMRHEDSIKLIKEISSKNKLKEEMDAIHFGIDRFTVMEPEIKSLSRGMVDNMRSEYLQSTFVDAFEIAALSSGTNLAILSSENLETGGTTLFNQMNTIKATSEQILKEVRVNSLPVDFLANQQLKTITGSSMIMLPVVVNSFDPDLSKEFIIAASILFPVAMVTFPIYFPIKLLNGNQTSIRLLILDTDTGEMIYRDAHNVRMPLNKYNLAGHIYEYLNHFKLAPTK